MSKKIPEGWKKVKLGEICIDISYGYTASAKPDPVGPKLLRITDIVSDRINWETVPYCKISDKNIKKYKLEVGDIVIARTGATTGYNKTIKDNIKSVFASYLIRYKTNIEIADPFFVGYNLQSYRWKGFVENIIGGSAQPGANAKQFASFEFLLPPLSEQKAIASILSSLDDKIDLLHRQNKTLEQMAETLFRKWFIEEAKEDWEEKPLGDLIKISSGKGLKKEQLIKNGRYPILGANGEIGKTNNWLFEGELIFTGRVGTLGNVFIVHKNEKVWLSDNTLIIKPKNYFYFIYFTLKNARLEKYNVGSTQPLIRQTDIKKLKLYLPYCTLLEKFERNTKKLFDKIQSNKLQIHTLENLRDTLLPKLMRGKVRVKVGR